MIRATHERGVGVPSSRSLATALMNPFRVPSRNDNALIGEPIRDGQKLPPLGGLTTMQPLVGGWEMPTRIGSVWYHFVSMCGSR